MMLYFFFNRVIRNKNFYFSLLIANGISLLYIIFDIFPNAKYGGNPYTRWIGSFTGSHLPFILFMLLPIISALSFSDTYLKDKNSGLIHTIISKGRHKEYFRDLFIVNFLVGGFSFASSLITNVYFCFMLLQDQPVDMLVNGNGNVSLLFSDTLFPTFYYAHPFLHMSFYIILAFIVAGLYSSLALSTSLFISHKKTFIVFFSPYVLNYLYDILILDMEFNSSMMFTSFSKQISSPILSPIVILTALTVFLVICLVLYTLGVRRNVQL